jgi:hypothetical protein
MSSESVVDIAPEQAADIIGIRTLSGRRRPMHGSSARWSGHCGKPTA